MTLIVEFGTGIYEANSYAGLSYAHSYLHRRNRNTAWDSATAVLREAALVAATDYIDKRFGSMFLGTKEFVDLAVANSNYLAFLTQPQNNNTLTIGTVTYTYKSSAPGAGEIAIGASITETIANTLATIASHPQVDAENSGSNSIIVRDKLTGEQEAILTSSNNPTHLSWDFPQLVGGSDSIEQALEWPRVGVYTRAGTQITGIPEKLRQATVEYASRALTETLMPDPVTGDTGQEIRRLFEKVGPIETETAYSATVKQIFKKYPEADKLLVELIGANGGVYR